MAAVMDHLHLGTLRYQPANGSCAGLLIYDTTMGVTKYWPEVPPPPVIDP